MTTANETTGGRQSSTAVHLVVTRHPAEMLPAADGRAVQIKKGDRVP